MSSTLEELAAERTAARQAIERLRLTPVLFELGARPFPPRDLYRAYLDQSHVFIGIYGHKYGWIGPGESVSGLEDEYLLSGHRPKLIYIKRTPARREPRLDALLERITADDIASYREFATAAELQELVENDLAVMLTERFEQFVRPHTEPAPTNLPVPRNPLVGRDRELAAACDLLRHEDVYLVTLTGPGGCGKSRLGLQVALELLTDFGDGTFMVTLESVRDPTMVVPAIAETLGVAETPGRNPLETLSDYLRDAHTLLLLDNFEQVVAVAPTISMLLESCPRLAVLVTSRTPLRVRGEHELAIPPLATPSSDDADPRLLSQYASVALFVQRARAVRADFALTNETAPVIAEICNRLDGLPLAIELAAARLKILSPEALLGRLASRFELLRGGTRDLPERHRTLRGAIDWSYDLLDDAGKRMFRRLAVFAGGSTLDAAETVCGVDHDPEEEVLEVIASLVDGSMLTTSVGDDGDLRIGMLETIRAYATEQLVASGEAEGIRREHAEYFCALSEQAKPHMVEADEPWWAVRLRVERDNLRLALEWSIEHDVELGLRLGSSLFRFWEAHNMIAEGHGWLRILIARPSPPSAARASALRAAAALGCYLGEYDAARACVSEGLAIFQSLDDRRGVASALNELGVLASYEGDFAEAGRLLEQSLAIKHELGDDWLTANTIMNLGLVAGWGGDHARSYELHAECLALFESLGDRIGATSARHNLAQAAMHLGRLEEALEGHTASLQLFADAGDLDGCAESLEGLAMLANARGDSRRAAQLFGLSATTRKQAGTQPPMHHQAEVQREFDITRSRLDQQTFDEAVQAGREMTVERALELATGLKPPESDQEESTPHDV